MPPPTLARVGDIVGIPPLCACTPPVPSPRILQLVVEFTARSVNQLARAFFYILLGARIIQVTLTDMAATLTLPSNASIPSIATALATLRAAGFYLVLGILVILLEDALQFVPGTSLLALGLHVLVRAATVGAVSHFVPGTASNVVFAFLLGQYYHRWVEPLLNDVLEQRAGLPPTIPAAYPPRRKITFADTPTPPPRRLTTPQQENDARIVERINKFIPVLFDYLSNAPPRITIIFGRLIAELVIRVAKPVGRAARLRPEPPVRALKRAIVRQLRLVKTSREGTCKRLARTLAIITVVQGMREVYEVAFQGLTLYPNNPGNNPGDHEGRHEHLEPLLELGSDAVDVLLSVLASSGLSMVSRLSESETPGTVRDEMARIEKVVKGAMDERWADMVMKALYASLGVELIAHLAKGEDNWESLLDSEALETFRHTGVRLLSNTSEAGIWHAATRLLKWCAGTDDRRERNMEAALLGICARATVRKRQPSTRTAREVLAAMRYSPFDDMFGLRSLFPDELGDVKADWAMPGLRLHRNGVANEIRQRYFAFEHACESGELWRDG